MKFTSRSPLLRYALWTLTAALALALCVGGLTACRSTPPAGTDGTAPADTPSGSETAALPTEAPTNALTEPETVPAERPSLWLDGEGKLLYTVILPAGAGREMRVAAETLADAFVRLCGCAREAVTVTDDATRPSGGDAMREILLGHTDRPESEALYEALEVDAYTVATTKDKILLVGYNEAATAQAVSYFIDSVLGFGSSETPAEPPLPTEAMTLFAYAPSDADKAAYAAALNAPHIVSPRYPTADVVVADIELRPDNPLYPVDNTGMGDCTQIINDALAAVSLAGGGTVYLPEGRYLVTGSITVPPFCCLRGDWQDPDLVRDGVSYGTVILARQEAVATEALAAEQALFLIGGSAGVRGMTVFYPEQSLANVKTFPFTFYANGYMLPTVMECTVLNGYRGIGASTLGTAHEMFTVDSFKGTFLGTAAEVYNQADVGTWKSVAVSGRYWAECRLGDAPAIEAVNAYTREHADGLILGDLEWTEFANLRISDCRNGIRIVSGHRIQFAGSIFDAEIRDCDIGIKIENMDTRWGTVIANSIVEGSICAIRNDVDAMVKLANVTLLGELIGQSMTDPAEALADRTLDYAVDYARPAARLFVVTADKTGTEDATAAIQAEIDAAAKAGGGVVYLPAGFYLCRERLTLPAGVELRGSASVPTRDQWGLSMGTVLLVQYGVGDGFDATSPAFITLGERAGISGIRLFYHTNSPLKLGEGQSLSTTYAVRGTGAEVYVVNCCVAAASFGIDFGDCDRHYIQKYIACCYENAMRLGGTGGVVEGCLQNATVLCRIGATLPVPNGWFVEEALFTHVFDPITRLSSRYIILEAGEGQVIYNTFAYGVNRLVTVEGATDVFLCNLGSDNLGGRGYQLYVNDGSVTAVNLLRWNGASYKLAGGKIALYNRLTIEKKDETTVIS